MNTIPFENLTLEQQLAFTRLKARFPDLDGPYPSFGCDSCVMCRAAGMYIGIERDGYTHT